MVYEQGQFMSQQEIFIGFIAYGLISSAIGLFSFFVIKNAKFKQALWTFQNVTFGIFLIGYIYLSGGGGAKLLVWVPLVTLVSIYNVHSVKFCSSCGKTNTRKSGFSAIKSCGDCGNTL